MCAKSTKCNIRNPLRNPSHNGMLSSGRLEHARCAHCIHARSPLVGSSTHTQLCCSLHVLLSSVRNQSFACFNKHSVMRAKWLSPSDAAARYSKNLRTPAYIHIIQQPLLQIQPALASSFIHTTITTSAALTKHFAGDCESFTHTCSFL